MKFEFKTSGKRFQVDTQSKEFTNARSWLFESRPGGWIVASRTREDGSIERARFFVSSASGTVSFHSPLRGSFFGTWGRLESGRTSAAAGSGASDFTAQFPGKVRKILVADGAAVVENQKLLLVEAMKMEFAIHAPVAGVVKRIRVNEGQQLSPGDLLVDFEAKSGG